MAEKMVGANAPDVVIRRERPGVPLAFVRAVSPRGRAWLVSATTAGDDAPLRELGDAWPCEHGDVQAIARAAVAAGLTIGEERPS